MTEVEKDFGVLESFNFTPKTKTEINKIIDGVLSAKNGGNEYRWANEDILVIAYAEAIYFIDLLTMRRSVAKKEQDLTLSHEDFIFKRLQKIYIRK